MDPILALLQKNGRYSVDEIASLTGCEAAEVAAKIAAWEKEGTILGYQAVLDNEKTSEEGVTALIEVKITPERGGGFDRIAQRIARFDQVKTCLLMSGGYDLTVLVTGNDLREVARFVSEKLSSLDGVLSTATHFQLKAYKLNGLLAQAEAAAARLPVAP